MRCDHCGSQVPEGLFCTRCGAHQPTRGLRPHASARVRLDRFAVRPGEHVLRLSVLTTLLPHLAEHKLHEFRWALIGGLAGLFALYLLGLIVPALLLAAVLVPAIYLLYLYEAQVYRDEPLLVVGLTFGGGALLGLLVAGATALIVNPALASETWRPDLATVVKLVVLIPVVQEISKPIPALVLRERPRFGETVDGLVFGVAAGLGFSFTSALMHVWGLLTSLPLVTSPANWIFPLLGIGVLSPLLHGSTTGAITAALWRLGRGRFGGREIGALAVALLARLGFEVGGQLLESGGFSPIATLVWEAAVVGGLVCYIRYLLHHALLDEATDMGFSERVCPHCQRHVVAAGFCPVCGASLAVAPRGVPTQPSPAGASV